MFAATRVMTAGKAGLESLPYFVDELLAQGITQLAPWAADHSSEQTGKLGDATRERQRGPWRKIYEIGDGDLGTIIRPEMAASQRLLDKINPLAGEVARNSSDLADSPAYMAAWCRLNIWQHCRDTVSLWDKFKYENGTARDQQLAVVIPFCPEGPTSGTVGMYLGAALRKHFADAGRGNELVVWGIELCPPVDDNIDDKLALQNIFRGYVARRELMEGLPLTEDPDDGDFIAPFDINIVFDGGATHVAGRSKEDIWHALDRAAAQTTACLLNGAAGGDVSESTNWLKQGKRWNAYLVHVVSEHAYSPACRYLHYRVNLPWHRDPEAWNRTSTRQRKDAFLRRIDNEVLSLLASENDPFVREKIEWTVARADEVKGINLNIFGSLTGNQKKVEGLLEDVVASDERWYKQVCEEDPAPNRIIPKTDAFCITVALTDSLRLESANELRDSNAFGPIAGVLGASGTINVRDSIESLVWQVLRRSDCQSTNVDSQALFEEIIAISIEDRSRKGSNDEFRPAREFLYDFIGSENRQIPGSFNPLVYDLSEKMQQKGRPKAFGWRVIGADYEFPVEYSFLTLARCRQEDGFKDVSTYDRLKQQHEAITGGSLSVWQEYARYYGVKPPPELLVDYAPSTQSPADADSSKTKLVTNANTSNGHRMESDPAQSAV